MFSGDRAFAGSFLPGISTTLAWFRRHKNADGLLSALPYFNATSWTLGWWRATCPGSEEGPTTVINAQYVHALECAALVAKEAGEKDEARRFQKEAAEVREAVNGVLWSESEGLYFDRPGGPELSVYCNAWAIVAEIPNRLRVQKMLQRFPRDPRLAEVDFFGQYFVFRALARVGHYELVSDLLRPWHDMATQGLSTWAEEPSFWRSLCHAWSAHPLLECLSEILGVQPLEPGFTKTQVAPRILTLAWAKGAVPTPLGPVEVSWRLEKTECILQVTSPARMALVIVAPGGERCEVAGGRFERRFALEASRAPS